MSQATNSQSPQQKAVILAARFPDEPDFEGLVEETRSLVHAADMTVSDVVVAPRRTVHKRSFVGKGKIEEANEALLASGATTLVVSHTLTDGQHARLSEECEAELIDHSGLILTIFASRAKTSEGKLQVELAQEMYGRAKLKNAWTHLERQRGGLGATGGPGESQLELDKRMVARKINILRKKLAKRKRHSDLVSSRRRDGSFTIALVGYTNAGKSTLFANLTKSNVPASPRLFETLTTTSRKIHLGDGKHAVLSDTVGFVRSLPHELIEAFQATLSEAVVANLLLVVVDASDPNFAAKIEVIESTLEGIDASGVPKMVVLNKSDLSNGTVVPDFYGWDKIPVLKVSARTGEGIPKLRSMISERIPNILTKQKQYNPQHLDD